MKTITTIKYGSRQLFSVMAITSVLFGFSAKGQKETFIPSSQVTIRTIIPGSRNPVTGGDPTAKYSNITHDLNVVHANGGAAADPADPNYAITYLVADNLTLLNPIPDSIVSITFSVSNSSNTVVRARPRVRFYQADGPNGTPGTLITGYSFSPFDFAANSAQTLTSTVNPFAVKTSTIWAGITFDNHDVQNNVNTGATIAQLNALGQKTFNPVDRGSSTDLYFQSSSNGSFLSSTPPGSTATLGGNPIANFGWELVPRVSPLPINIEYLKGSNDGTNNILEWKVDCINTSKADMVLQRSSNSTLFTDIYSVQASATQCAAGPFLYKDLNNNLPVSYYRLKMTDDAGILKYSEIVSILNKTTAFEISSVYPNPVTSNILNLQIISSQKGIIIYQMYDVAGRVLLNGNRVLSAGLNKLSINLNTVTKGSYTLKIMDIDGGSHVVPLLKN